MKRRLFGWVLFIALAVMLVGLLTKPGNRFPGIPLSSFNQLLKKDRIAWIEVRDDWLNGELRTAEEINGRKIARFAVELPTGTTGDWGFTNWLLDNAGNARVEAKKDQNLLLQFVLPLIPWLMIFGFIWFFVFRLLRQRNRGEPQRVFVVNQTGEASTEQQQPPS